VEEDLIRPNSISLQQISTQGYVMKVNLFPVIANVTTCWQVPIIVNKIADDSVVELMVTKNPIGEIKYPIEIPITEYSLEKTSCRWGARPIDCPLRSLIHINNDEELEKYIICGEGEYPAIDFTKYTLLATYIASGSPMRINTANFSKDNINEYTLQLLIYRSVIDLTTVQCFAFLVPKLSNDENITLHISFYEPL